MASNNPSNLPTWPEQIYQVFQEAGIRQVVFVPDAGHTRLINLCLADRNIHAVSLTTEEEGVAMLAGAWLGGDRGALLMQSSGVGNCINMFSLIQECRFPLLTLVTMRGQWGEANPWQVPMGQGTPGALQSAGVIVHSVDEAARVSETVAAAATLAFRCTRAVAVLIGQRVIGSKKFETRESDA